MCALVLLVWWMRETKRRWGQKNQVVILAIHNGLLVCGLRAVPQPYVLFAILSRALGLVSVRAKIDGGKYVKYSTYVAC